MIWLGDTPPPGSMLKPGGPRQKTKQSGFRDKRDGMDEAHLANVRKCPCCVCLKMPAGEAHHLQSSGERGMSLRATDQWAVPLCFKHHTGDDGVHRVASRREPEWFGERGIDAVWLAKALWNSRGDLAAMTKIVLAHRGNK